MLAMRGSCLLVYVRYRVLKESVTGISDESFRGRLDDLRGLHPVPSGFAFFLSVAESDVQTC